MSRRVFHPCAHCGHGDARDGRIYCSLSCRETAFAMRAVRKFHSSYTKGDGCWEWRGAIADNGYGTVSAGAFFSRQHAHRVSYAIHVGPVPNGLFVCHKCDNRKCINPAHLFLGTQSDNIRDCVAKGRYKRPSGVSRGTHCRRGHKFSYVDRRGAQFCRTCHAERARVNRRRRQMTRQERMAS